MTFDSHASVVFAWLPVDLYEVRNHTWCPTGRRVWLQLVRRVRTFWGETYYTEVPHA
jgi:hypothetical protein